MARSFIDSTPFATNSANVFSLLATAEQEHAQRLTRYRTNWQFYKGRHWDWQRDKSDPFVTVNYSRKFVDVHVNFLMKRGFSVTVPDDPATPAREDEDREFIRHMLDQTWKDNNKGLISIEMAQMGGITGDCFVRVSWDDEPLFGKPHARIDVLPSQFVFPEFGGPVGVDRKKVNSVLVLFPRYETGDVPIRRPYGTPDKRIEVFGERWFKNRVEVYDSRGAGTNSLGEPIEVRDNPLGEIPIVHIANYPIAGEFYGMSDLEGLLDLNREFNEKATDISDVISYHGSPVTVISGAKVAQLERGANRIWGLPAEASVKNLELNGNLDASMTYLKLVKAVMHEIGSVPEGVLGSFQATEAMSAAAVALRYMPLIDVRDVKILTYGAGIQRINRLVMKTTSIMDAEFRSQFTSLDKFTRFRSEVVFAPPLPRDESIELDKATTRMESGLTTRRYEQENTLGLSQSEIEKMEKDRAAEREQDAELEFQLGQKFAEEEEPEDLGGGFPKESSGNPNPVRPNPDVQGEKRSIAVQLEPDT